MNGRLSVERSHMKPGPCPCMKPGLRPGAGSHTVSWPKSRITSLMIGVQSSRVFMGISFFVKNKSGNKELFLIIDKTGAKTSQEKALLTDN